MPIARIWPSVSISTGKRPFRSFRQVHTPLPLRILFSVWSSRWQSKWFSFLKRGKWVLSLLQCLPMVGYRVFGVNCRVFFVYILNLIRSFIAWKNQSARHTQKSVTTAFCSRVASDILRLAVVCRRQLFVQPSGTKELAFHAITTTGWTPLKQHLSYSAAWTAVCCDFIGAGSLFRITYVCVCAMTSNGNSKNKTGTVSETAESPAVCRPLCEAVWA